MRVKESSMRFIYIHAQLSLYFDRGELHLRADYLQLSSSFCIFSGVFSVAGDSCFCVVTCNINRVIVGPWPGHSRVLVMIDDRSIARQRRAYRHISVQLNTEARAYLYARRIFKKVAVIGSNITVLLILCIQAQCLGAALEATSAWLVKRMSVPQHAPAAKNC